MKNGKKKLHLLLYGLFFLLCLIPCRVIQAGAVCGRISSFSGGGAGGDHSW